MKRILSLLICLMLLPYNALAISPANNKLKVGLYYGSSALSSANLLNQTGSGYEFGYFDSKNAFVALAKTDIESIAVTASDNIYLGSDNKYYENKPADTKSIISQYRIQLNQSFNSFDEAKAYLTKHKNSHVAYVNSKYHVRIGPFANKAEAEQYAKSVSDANKVISAQITVLQAETNNIIFEYANKNNFAINPNGDETWFKGYKYGGAFEYIIDNKNKVSVINIIDIEEYVKGVVPYEVNSSWPIEALKAQAIAARTYGVLNIGKHKKYGFDVCSSIDCQVYKGTNSAADSTDRAVDATKGEYITYKSKPINAVFHSSNGGATEDSENIWGSKHHYLRGVYDNFENLETSHNGIWETYVTNEQILRILKSKNVDISGVSDMYVEKFTAKGNVLDLIVVDTNGKKHKFSREKARTILNSSSEKVAVNSQRYTLEKGDTRGIASGEIYIGENKVSYDSPINIIGANGTISEKVDMKGINVITAKGTNAISNQADAKPSGAGYTIKGTGWGHNVGMSQNGAKAMAEQGYSYDQIIKFYYTGVEIERE